MIARIEGGYPAQHRCDAILNEPAHRRNIGGEPLAAFRRTDRLAGDGLAGLQQGR